MYTLATTGDLSPKTATMSPETATVNNTMFFNLYFIWQNSNEEINTVVLLYI